MSLTGFNIRRRELAKKLKSEKPVISNEVEVETKKEEVKTESKATKTSTTVHKKTVNKK